MFRYQTWRSLYLFKVNILHSRKNHRWLDLSFFKICLLSVLALVYNFNVDVLPDAQNYANTNNVTIKHQNIIYRFLEDIKNEINLRLPPKEVEEIIGTTFFLLLLLKKKKVFLVTAGNFII